MIPEEIKASPGDSVTIYTSGGHQFDHAWMTDKSSRDTWVVVYEGQYLFIKHVDIVAIHVHKEF